MIGAQQLDAVFGVVVARIGEGGRRESLPGSPVRPLPGGEKPVDPANPVPPARSN